MREIMTISGERRVAGIGTGGGNGAGRGVLQLVKRWCSGFPKNA